ncbi:unnamed protein product [Linum trigynum]|uniref:Uncharacterized protein n=1 Tax=Linum trigynum TaxID=586398 RepID=A0AAV2CJQ1_9ROSI
MKVKNSNWVVSFPSHRPVPFNLPTSETSPHEQSSSPSPAPVLGRGLRQRWPSKRLDIYDTNVHSASNVKYHISSQVSYARCTSRYRAFAAAVTRTPEPRYFHEAVRCPHWCAAMKTEVQALEANKTWTLVDPPPGVHLIDSKWVFRILNATKCH